MSKRIVMMGDFSQRRSKRKVQNLAWTPHGLQLLQTAEVVVPVLGGIGFKELVEIAYFEENLWEVQLQIALSNVYDIIRLGY